MTITVNKTGNPTSFSGDKAVDVFRSLMPFRCLHSALGLLKNGIKPSRGWTITRALEMATEYTGNKYKRTEIEKAQEELKKIENLRVRTIPIEETKL